jgi:hypothetical protein
LQRQLRQRPHATMARVRRASARIAASS